MSLLDLLKSEDPAVAQGLLQAGLSLLGSKGGLGNALGQAGMQGMQGATQFRQQQFQRQLQQSQIEDMKRKRMMEGRQDALDALPGRYIVPPSQPGMDATGGMETALEAPQNQASPAGRMDLAGLAKAFMATPGGLQQGLGLQQSIQKQAPQLHAWKPGDVVGTFEGGQVQEKFRVPERPDASKLSKLAQLRTERDALPPNDPMRRIYDQAIAKESTHTPAASIVNYGSPVPVELPGGGVGYVQPTNRGGPVSPMTTPQGQPLRKPKDVPAALQEKIAQNAVTLQKIDKAVQLVEKTPASLGAQNYLGDPIMQRMDPAGVEVRAMVADIGGQKIHDRSGAAVTVGEAERLKPYIPAATDNAETVKKKLKLFRAEYSSMQQAIQSGASISQAAQVAPAAAESSGGAAFSDPAKQARYEAWKKAQEK